MRKTQHKYAIAPITPNYPFTHNYLLYIYMSQYVCTMYAVCTQCVKIVRECRVLEVSNCPLLMCIFSVRYFFTSLGISINLKCQATANTLKWMSS